jgi:hypothetical protein
MVRIDHAFENLKRIEQAGWTVPADHPDLVPASEAGQLAEAYRLLFDDQEVRDMPEDFRAMLTVSHQQAAELERELVGSDLGQAETRQRLSERMARLAKSCKDCHAPYRD